MPQASDRMRTRFVFAAALAASIAAGGMDARTAPAQGPPAAAPAPTGPRPPAASLSRPTTPSKPPDAAGFIRRWLVLEPIPVPPPLGEAAVRALVEDAGFADLRMATPADGERVTIGDQQVAWHALDTLGYNLNLFHFAYALGKPTSNVLFWTATVVDVPREIPDVRLAIGSNAASVWWLNGDEVIGLYNDRQTVIDDGVSRRVTLKKGPNVIRAAIVNGGGATDFCARFVDERGNPVSGFTTRTVAGGASR
jgi:hypothetical protein